MSHTTTTIPTSTACRPEAARSPTASELVLTLWTNDPALAARADAAGVDRIGLDLERLGKARRQAGLATWISDHREEDFPPLAHALSGAELFARCNPLHGSTAGEVDRLIAAGVGVIMLPMFRTADDVRTFVEHVAGRARVVVLLETAAAAGRVREIGRVPGVAEIHVGLNDLTLDLGLTNRFGLLASAALERVAAGVRDAGLHLGIGGIGRARDDGLPVPTGLVYAALARLGADATLISRSFAARGIDFEVEVRRARSEMRLWRDAGTLEHARARARLSRVASALRF